MRKLWLLLILLIAIVITGCSELNNVKSPKGVVCDSPYIRFEDGCCLDQNGNSICDRDEGNVEKETKKEDVTLQVTFVKVGICDTYDDCFKQVIGVSQSEAEKDPEMSTDMLDFFKQQIRCRNNVCEISDILYETWESSFTKGIEEE